MSEQIQPTEFNQIDQQLADHNTATVLVERTDGSITPGQIVGRGEHGTRVYFGNLNEAGEGLPPSKKVSKEQLADDHQEKLARELAGVAFIETKEKSSEVFDEQAAIEAAAIRPVKPDSHSYEPKYIAPPTDAQIANAKQHGFDLEKQKIYFSQVEWDNRNKK